MGEGQSIRLDSTTTTQQPTGGPPASQGLAQSEADERLSIITYHLSVEAAKRKFFAVSRHQENSLARSAA